ncbi:MAG: SIMPL domain-containing protein [Patescibacteria group bacterium]
MQTFMEKNQGTIGLVGVFLAFFLIASTVKVIREVRFVGSGLNPTNTITVAGKGEVNKSPDTAKVFFSVRNEKRVLKEAQDEVSAKIGKIKTELIAKGVEEKYIKTDSYTSYPQYDYNQARCYSSYCPPSTPTLRGYEVAHSITISIKNLDAVESVLGILATNTVTDMNGPNFGFEDDKMVTREARDLAIADAKAEAEKLAKSLGVRIVRIVSFSENGGGYPMPMYAKAEMGAALDMNQNTPQIPVGEQKVSSNVTIVYEIR